MSLKNKVTPEEWQVRVDLAAAYRLCEFYDMTDLTGTHLSARVPGERNNFLLNPYGLYFEEVTASSLASILQVILYIVLFYQAETILML